MKTVERFWFFYVVLFPLCLLSGCAGSMSDVTIPISMESLLDFDSGQKPSAHIEVVDLRRDATLRRTAFSASLGEITLSPPENELVKQLVANALIRVAGDGGRWRDLSTVYCGIKTLDIVTPATLLYWDVTTRIELILRIRGDERAVFGEAVERTWIYPSEQIIQRVTTRALRDVAAALEQELRTMLAAAP